MPGASPRPTASSPGANSCFSDAAEIEAGVFKTGRYALSRSEPDFDDQSHDAENRGLNSKNRTNSVQDFPLSRANVSVTTDASRSLGYRNGVAQYLISDRSSNQ